VHPSARTPSLTPVPESSETNPNETLWDGCPPPRYRFQSAEMALFKAIGGPFCDDLVVIPLAMLPSGRADRREPARRHPTRAQYRPVYFLVPGARHLFGAGLAPQPPPPSALRVAASLPRNASEERAMARSFFSRRAARTLSLLVPDRPAPANCRRSAATKPLRSHRAIAAPADRTETPGFNPPYRSSAKGYAPTTPENRRREKPPPSCSSRLNFLPPCAQRPRKRRLSEAGALVIAPIGAQEETQFCRTRHRMRT
jgi:hypothetical protein